MGDFTRLKDMTLKTQIPKASEDKEALPLIKTDEIKPDNRTGEPSNRTVIDDLQGLSTVAKRPTERYSFEIYTDQKKKVSKIVYLYGEKTGEKISASRIIREALDTYLNRVLETLES